MINITLNGVSDTGYYTDVFLKTFTINPSPEGLLATFTIVADVTTHTIEDVRNKVDGNNTFGIEVIESGNRNGVYAVNSKPIIVQSEVDASEGIGVLFVGTRIFQPK